MTTLFIGYRSNQALAILRERMPGKVVFLDLERYPRELPFYQACLATARRLELELCEVVLRRLPNGRYQAVDLIPFLTPGTLAVPEVLEAALNLAWEGVPA